MLVLGYEGDTSITSKKGSASEFPPNAGFSNEVKERWLSTFRGRVGVRQDNWLLYATAGGALANVENTITSPVGTQISEKHWHWGWTAGAGVEVKLSQDWSAKMEYLYVGLQDKSYFNPAPSARFPSNQSRARRRPRRARRRELQAALERARHFLQALSSEFLAREIDPDRDVIGRLLPAAHVLVDAGGDRRSAACGDSSRWSMRMPSFFCQAPAW